MRIGLLAAAVALCGVTCKKEKRKPAPVLSFWQVLPSDATAVFAVHSQVLQSSRLTAFMRRELASAAPDVAKRLDGLDKTCGVDVKRQIITVALMHSATSGGSIMVVQGDFAPQTVEKCLRGLAPSRVKTTEPLAGHPTFIVSRAARESLWVAHVASVGVVVSSSAGYLRSALTPKKTNSPLETHLASVLDADAWGIGQVPPAVGQSLLEKSGGAIKNPVQYAVVTLSLAKSPRLGALLHMKTADDATALAGFLKQDLPQMATIAQLLRIGGAVGRAEIKAESKHVQVWMVLSPAEWADFLGVIDKEGASLHTPPSPQ